MTSPFIIYSLVFGAFISGALFGAVWVTTRREGWLRRHQPYTPDGIDLSDQSYDRIVTRLRAGGL